MQEHAIAVYVRLLSATAVPPARQTAGSAGFDLTASEARVIEPGKVGLVPTGIALALPGGYEAQVRPRSGLALRHGIGLLNAPGTIDSDYRGEIKVILFNFGDAPFEVRPGDRIAQLVLQRVVQARFEEVDSLPETSRGAGGFGHTGR